MKADSHPADDRLVALYFDDREVETSGQRLVRQHLHGCEACTWRYTELVAPLERLRADAASEADEVFTPARLEAQRAAIHERLEQGARASRVIPFPSGSRLVDRAVIGRPMFRWVALAAAAGLLVGVSAGRFLDFGSRRQQPASQVAADASRRSAPIAPAASDSAFPALTDEALMWEVDAAVSRHRIAALAAIDDLTPHARETVLASR